jgi:hypothetical protein
MIWPSLAALLAALGLAAAPEPPAPKPAPYPLETCLVSGDPFGPKVRGVSTVHEGREIKFCCGECKWSFLENPEKYLKKLEAAARPMATQ